MKLIIVNADSRTFYNMVFSLDPRLPYLGYQFTTSTSLEEVLR